MTKRKERYCVVLKIKIVFKMLPPPETIVRPLASLLIPYSHSDIFEYLTWRLYSTCTHIHGYNVILHLSSLGHVMSGSQKTCTKKKNSKKSYHEPTQHFVFLLSLLLFRYVHFFFPPVVPHTPTTRTHRSRAMFRISCVDVIYYNIGKTDNTCSREWDTRALAEMKIRHT